MTTMSRWVVWLLAAGALAACQSTTETVKGSADGDDSAGANGSSGDSNGGDNGGDVTGGGTGPSDTSGDDGPADPPPPPEPPGEIIGDTWVPAAGALALRDAETGTLWNLRGEAFDGPLAEEGARLTQLPAYSAFWFAWSVFNHDTDVWSAEGIETQDVSPVEGAGQCDVPCAEIISGGPPQDGIPSIDHDDVVGQLTMVEPEHPGAAYLQDDDFVLGVVIEDADGNRHPRAYSHNLLWWHEIANDQIAGEIFTVSFCPLTGSGILNWPGEQGFSFGTSGRLFNSNLVMYDRVTGTLWSQMLQRGIRGSELGDRLSMGPITETTWGQWRRMWPDTRVASDDTGHGRNYQSYPYGDYRTNHDNTFRPTNPDYHRGIQAKTRTLGVRVGGAARGYPYDRLGDLGPRAVVNDTLGEVPLAVVWQADGRLALPFDRRMGDRVLTFEVVEAP